jgi:hypothetical protein
VQSDATPQTGSTDHPSTDSRGFGVADLARRWRVGEDKIHAFIRKGELIAFNVATELSGRPQWRIAPEEVQRFEKRRSSAPVPKSARRHRRAPALIDYFPDA